jgi:hypothetical protein
MLSELLQIKAAERTACGRGAVSLAPTAPTGMS